MIFTQKAKRMVAAILSLAIILVFSTAAAKEPTLSITDFGDRGLDAFFLASGNGVPVEMLVGICLYEGRDIKNPDAIVLCKIAEILRDGSGKSERNQLRHYIQSSTARTKIQNQMARMSDILHVKNNKVFPLYDDAVYWYEDSWMAPRDFGGERSHEGIDIICETGTPIRSMSDGYIERIGWNTLGGWRIGIRGADGVYYYYAHMSEYAPGMRIGRAIKKGETIGFSGSTGYGPEVTDDVMIPHLHISMYVGEGHVAVNPYPFLRHFENLGKNR